MAQVVQRGLRGGVRFDGGRGQCHGDHLQAFDAGRGERPGQGFEIDVGMPVGNVAQRGGKVGFVIAVDEQRVLGPHPRIEAAQQFRSDRGGEDRFQFQRNPR